MVGLFFKYIYKCHWGIISPYIQFCSENEAWLDLLRSLPIGIIPLLLMPKLNKRPEKFKFFSVILLSVCYLRHSMEILIFITVNITAQSKFLSCYICTPKQNTMYFEILDPLYSCSRCFLHWRMNFSKGMYGNCLSSNDFAFPLIKEKLHSLQWCKITQIIKL